MLDKRTMKPVEPGRLREVHGGTRDCSAEFAAVDAAKANAAAAYSAWRTAYQANPNDPSKWNHLRKAEGDAYLATQQPWNDLQACLPPEQK